MVSQPSLNSLRPFQFPISMSAIIKSNCKHVVIFSSLFFCNNSTDSPSHKVFMRLGIDKYLRPEVIPYLSIVDGLEDLIFKKRDVQNFIIGKFYQIKEYVEMLWHKA